MKRLLPLFLALTVSLSMSAQQPRKVIAGAYSKVDKSVISTGGNWFPYPSYEDRAGWDRLTGAHKASMIKAGEKFLNYDWKVIKATDYLEFERSGNRSTMESPNRDNTLALAYLVMAELSEGKGRFIDQIINGIWYHTERTSWVISAHQFYQKSHRSIPDSRDVIIDLGSQKTGMLVAITQHFFRAEFDKVDPSISYAVDAALKRNIFDPYLDKSKYDSHWWLGFDGKHVNNWCPWCNANVILACLLEEKDRSRLLAEMEQSVRSVDMYLDVNKMDGGCDEGPGYWFHAACMLYDYLHIMNDATGGSLGLYDDPQVRNMALYESRASIGDGWSVNFGDGSPHAASSKFEEIYRFGKDCGLKELTDFAISIDAFNNGKKLGSCSLEYDDIYHVLETLRYEPEYAEAAKGALESAGGDVDLMQKQLRSSVPPITWYKETEHLVMKNDEGWCLAAKGGYNAESHNHNDVGSCILMMDNMPVLIDAGVGTYTRQTFSSERYSIWTMRSEWHNLPSVNGMSEHQGREFASRNVKVDEKNYTMSLDIAGAFEPEAACDSWIRTYALKADGLTITDKFSLSERKAADVEHFMVNGKVDVSIPGTVIIEISSTDGSRKGKVKMLYPKTLKVSTDKVELKDPKLERNWKTESLTRISLTSAENAPVKGSYVIRFVKD